MKRSKGGSSSQEQKAWASTLEAKGFPVILAKGCADAVRQLRDLGYRLGA
jgi:hypothetical protein